MTSLSKRLPKLHATDDNAFEALPEEARLWYQSQQLQSRKNAANFYEDTSDHVKHKNLVTAQERGMAPCSSSKQKVKLYCADL